MPRAELLGRFLRPVDRRIDRPEQAGLGVLEGRRELREPDAADDHQVDIARRELVSAGHRAVDEGHIDAASEPRQALGQDILEPRGPEQQSAEIAEDRVVGLRPVIDPVPVHPPAEDLHGDQAGELAL